MIWGFQNEHQAMQKRFYRDSCNVNRGCAHAQRSEGKATQIDLGLIVEIAASVKSMRVSAFQPCKEIYLRRCDKHNKFVPVKHCGYIADAESFEDAAANLISMVRPMHPTLGEQMIKTVNNIGVNAR